MILRSQILDLLLDVNNSAQIPIDKRIDITTEAPGLSPIPSLVNDDDLAGIPPPRTAEGQAIMAELRALLAERTGLSSRSSLPKSLARLNTTVPHLTPESSALPPEMLAHLDPIAPETSPYPYLTPDQLDDYTYDIDVSLGTAPPLPIQFHTQQPDLTTGNHYSPYNWLRRNQPQIFLQDGESSEKSHGKPGALRGAGKRASIPAPSRPDALEIVEEDGLAYEFSLGSTLKGKRKRGPDDDDGGYHPKSGTKEEGSKKKPRARAPKKKVGEDGVETPARKRAKKAKPPTPDPDAHPFGPSKPALE